MMERNIFLFVLCIFKLCFDFTFVLIEIDVSETMFQNVHANFFSLDIYYNGITIFFSFLWGVFFLYTWF